MNIVYQNIEDSYYKIEIEDITFYFSSSFNLRRFKEKAINYSKNEEQKLINRYHVIINLKRYFLISFYKQIEKRGFLVKYKNNKYNDIFFVTNILK